MHRAIALGCIAISATLAGLYGWMSADTVFYGAIRAASLCAVAVVGACCPAWAAHHWAGRRFGQCALTWLVCAVCLAVTLGAGIGTIAGGAEQSTAERSRAITVAKDNRAEIERIQRERAKLDPRPIGTIKAELEAARAGRWYRATDGCTPTESNGTAAREACGAFRRLEGELGYSRNCWPSRRGFGAPTGYREPCAGSSASEPTSGGHLCPAAYPGRRCRSPIRFRGITCLGAGWHGRDDARRDDTGRSSGARDHACRNPPASRCDATRTGWRCAALPAGVPAARSGGTRYARRCLRAVSALV